MKHIKFWSIGIPCILLASVMLYVASCSSDDEPPAPPVPVPMEVVDEGADTNVTSKPLPGNSGTSSAGTEFSYKSWITLQKDASGGASYAPARGPKNAPSNDDVETITVMLQDVFHNLDTAIVVSSFDFGQPTSSITYTTNGQRKDGNVTITDSVMHYNVNFDGFSFWYTLEYEVGIYNDGINRIIMPYHKIKNLRDNGFSVEDMEFVLEPNSSGGKDVYLRKKIKHSITVEFSGADYTLHGNVILKKRVGTHPCIVSSELIDKGISDIDNQRNYTTYSSWAKVKHQYSDNRMETKTYSADMEGKLKGNRYGDKFLQSSDVSFISAKVESVDKHNIHNAEYYTVSEETLSLIVEYNLFTLTHALSQTHAHYNDGFVEFDFSELSYSNPKIELEVEYLENVNDPTYYQYHFFSRNIIDFGNANHRYSDEFIILVPK